MERLHPSVRTVWLVGALVGALIIGGILGVIDRYAFAVGSWVAPMAIAILALVGVGYTVFRYRIWKFEVREDTLYIERGVFTRVKTVVPFVRVQHVDSQRSPVERAVGLASVVVYTAGSRGADVTIPGLTPERAESLQERLRQLAIESEFEDAV